MMRGLLASHFDSTPISREGARRRADSMRRLWMIALRAALVGLLATLASPIAMAQSDAPSEEQTDERETDVDSTGLVIEAAVGFDGTVTRTGPTPVSFLITNYTEHIIEGNLVISSALERGEEVALGDIVVAPGASTRFSSIRAFTTWHECYATLSHGRKTLWRRELLLSTKDFNANVNSILLVDESGRKVQLPGAVSASTIGSVEVPVADKKGRPIECLSVKPWQLPNHHGPLLVAQTIVFPEGTLHSALNRAQWKAVGEWMCRGGTVFAHNASKEMIERLIESAPLGAETPVQSGSFNVRRVGLGVLYEYSQYVFAADSEPIRRQIAEVSMNAKRDRIGELFNPNNLYRSRGTRADINRTLVVVFVLGYSFLSGLMALILFRLNRRQIGIYIVSVVVVASVLSAALGGVLRLSKGDLRWMTVTQAGIGGAVEFAKIDAQSAGGRNTTVTVQGEQPDLQLIDSLSGYYNWNRRTMDYAAFNWQPNLAVNESDAYQINVPITPWGQRQLRATAFKKDFPRLEFKLEFSPVDSVNRNNQARAGMLDMPTGIFALKLKNRLPIRIANCWLIIGATRDFGDDANSGQANAAQAAQAAAMQLQRNFDQMGVPVGEGLVDVYHTQPLRGLSTGEAREEKFQAQFDVLRNNWNPAISMTNGGLMTPRISRFGTASAWIIAKLEDSPFLSIDADRSDFDPHEEIHYFIQEILPEDMPDASLFLKAKSADSKK